MTKVTKVKTKFKNPLEAAGWLWHIYNTTFDKDFGDIRDLSVMTKYTALILAALLIVFFASGKVGDTLSGIAAIILIILMIFWFGYFPFLIARIVKFYLKKFRS